jgi:hypothetical protein
MSWSSIQTRLKPFQIYLAIAILFAGSIGAVYAVRRYRLMMAPPILVMKATFGIDREGSNHSDVWFRNLGETAHSLTMTVYSVSRLHGLESVIGIASFGDSLPSDAIRHATINYIDPGDLRDGLVICFNYKTGAGRFHGIAFYYQSTPPTADAKDWYLRDLEPNTLAALKAYKICETF